MELHEKLAAIQKALSVPKEHRNSFGGYNYRNAEDITSAVKPLLNGLILTISDDLVQFPSNHPSQVVKLLNSKGNEVSEVVDGDRFYIKSTASITDGKTTISAIGFARESQNKAGMDDSQITGSASSYARKYALNGLFAIDDGNDADSTNTHKSEAEVSQDPADWVKPKQEALPVNLVCAEGNEPISKKVYDFSVSKYGKALCFDHQKTA